VADEVTVMGTPSYNTGAQLSEARHQLSQKEAQLAANVSKALAVPRCHRSNVCDVLARASVQADEIAARTAAEEATAAASEELHVARQVPHTASESSSSLMITISLHHLDFLCRSLRKHEENS